MSRLTGMDKVSFGAILTGRNAGVDDIDRIMGPTITTVPILADVDPSLSTRELAARLREKTLRMMPHEHLGIHAIRRASAACEAACGFQTVLVIQPPGQGIASGQKDEGAYSVMEELDETKIEGYPDQHGALNQYGLMMEILPSGGAGGCGVNKMTVRASFDSNLISAQRMERIISQWGHVMRQTLGTATAADGPCMPAGP